MARDYKSEYDNYHGKPEQRAKRSKRVLARRLMVKKYGEAKVRGKDVHHKDRNANNNALSNLSLRSKKANRSDNS
jgi:hypothetical protein|tara:strand:- start:65 stop:289 length:225 start_codon:yes stop_codon:yes gene_type:complete